MFKSNQDIFQTLAEAIPEGVLVVDEKQTIIATNTSTLEMFGYKAGELEGNQLNILIPGKYQPNHGAYFKGFYKQSEKRQMGRGRDLYAIKKSGKEFPVEVGLAPFKVSGKTFVMALLIDITHRKETERKILELNTQLEEKVKERTAELDKSVEELTKEIEKRKLAEKQALEALKKEKELNELKTKFLSMVSHEFKTPLTGILTSSRLVGKYEKAEHQGKRKKHLDTIANKVHYLNDILTDFLSVERIDSGKVNYKFSSFMLSKVLNEVIYDANMLLKSGQHINYPENIDELTIYFDEKILELILLNLIRNSIKYSPENTTIDVGIHVDDQKIIFKIIDQGIGIPEKDQKHIFERYFRAENASLNQGTGIGLNIVKGHLENLGGKISFISKENKGTTFIVEIPVLKPEAP